jgi:hypothetical protein
MGCTIDTERMDTLTADLDEALGTSATRSLPWRELAARRTGGSVVRLYWRPPEDDVVVYVEDEQSGDGFVLEPPSSDALTAFYHPYALRSPRY